jgi:RNA polymerase sigma-70 factor (ECF subfamily)
LRSLLPTEPEVAGLLALMLLTDARRHARFSAEGVLVPLAEQDRASWDADEIAEGLSLVRECLAVNRPGVYQIQAAVNAVHTTARTSADTDWSQIAALYAQLLVLSPSPVVALNRAIALAELDGPAVGLAEVDKLSLSGYHPWHATRAELLRRLDRPEEARAAYDAALALIDNPGEAAYLTLRRDQL